MQTNNKLFVPIVITIIASVISLTFVHCALPLHKSIYNDYTSHMRLSVKGEESSAHTFFVQSDQQHQRLRISSVKTDASGKNVTQLAISDYALGRVHLFTASNGQLRCISGHTNPSMNPFLFDQFHSAQYIGVNTTMNGDHLVTFYWKNVEWWKGGTVLNELWTDAFTGQPVKAVAGLTVLDWLDNDNQAPDLSLFQIQPELEQFCTQKLTHEELASFMDSPLPF